MGDLIKEINTHFDSAYQFKEQARRSKEQNLLYIDAAKQFHKAGLKSRIFLFLGGYESNEQFEINVYANYYYSEKYECLCAYYYHERKIACFSRAIKYHEKADRYLNEAIRCIEQGLANLPDEVRQKHNQHLALWKCFVEQNKAQLYAMKARAAWDNNRTIDALDYYRMAFEASKCVCEMYEDGVNKGIIEPVYQRIAGGNRIAMAANIASSVAKKSVENNLDEKSSVAVLRYILKVYQLSLKAYEQNPEWTEYQQGAQIVYSSMKAIIDKFPKWETLYIEFTDDSEVHKIMKSCDIKKYNNISKQFIPENNKMVKIWGIGSFFILLFIVIFLGFGLIAQNFSFWKAALIFVFGESVLLVIGILVLRATGDISEGGLRELVNLLLRLQFNLFSPSISKANKGTKDAVEED